MLLFSNPPMLVWLGYLMNRLRGQKYAVMVHDIYPDVLVRTNVLPEGHLAIRIWHWGNRRAYERASVVMTLGEYMAETLSRQFDPGKTAHKQIEIIPPWVDTEIIRPIPKEENWFAQKYDQVGKLTVMYSGNMGLGHDIETMLEAARQLRHRDDIHFMFIGAGPKWNLIDKALKREQLPNVTLLTWQPEEVIPYSLATADVALISLEPGFEGIMVPSKGSYAIAAGSVLILLSRDANELQDWIEQLNRGLTLNPGDIETFSQQLAIWANCSDYLHGTRQFTHKYSQCEFSRKICTNSFLQQLQIIFGLVSGSAIIQGSK